MTKELKKVTITLIALDNGDVKTDIRFLPKGVNLKKEAKISNILYITLKFLNMMKEISTYKKELKP